MSHVLHALSLSWSPAVIAALVGGLIVAINNAVRDRTQRSRESQGALKREQAAAYGELLIRSLSLAGRAQAVRGAVPLRSGIDEGLNVLLRLRKPLDPLEFHDWVGQDMSPLHEAWSRIWVVGTQEAMDAADRLVSAAGHLFGVLTADEVPGKVRRAIRGVRWTRAGETAYDKALARLAEERVAFARLMRQELGYAPVQFAIERAREEKAASSPCDL